MRDTKIDDHASSSGDSSGISLVERLRAGSSGAWAELVELYGPLVDTWCRRSQVPSHAIPDIAQEVFLTAFRSLDQFNSQLPNATFRGWLWTVARSRMVDFFRRQPNQHRAVGGSTALGNIRHLPDLCPVEEPTDVEQISALLHRALEQIRVDFTEATFDLFWRSTVLGHPTDLLARENGIQPAAVRQAKSRVLRRLRKHLGPCENGLSD